ncbi:Transmembrane protein [Orchesella cincta]|uniref:Transmembrane protein n=1 Tax=Orchesella cincta TaxID=48709 RepID=A0A1D2N3U3_ORCCI|nr:Transmembrane protein [Orchesella cincta]
MVVLHVVPVTSILPQVSQEGLLRPYRSYADVTLFHYYVPNEVSRATFEFAAFMDSRNCPVRDVYIYLQHGSYPVMAPDNATFPENLYTGRTSMFNLVLRSSYQPHDATVFPVYNPLPGSWFAAAYLPDWDQHVQQEGIGHKCQYSLGSVALWSQVSNVETIPVKTTTRLSSLEHFTYFKFYIPAGIWEFKLEINGCHFHSSHRFPEMETSGNTTGSGGGNQHSPIPCIRNVFLRPRALPRFKSDGTMTTITDLSDSELSHTERLPFTDSYYYILVVAETKVSYNISVFVKDCPVQILGRSFIQQFAGIHTAANLKDQAVRINMTTTVTTKVVSKEQQHGIDDDDDSTPFSCDCVPMFRLTRIKHAQDFSDTFLLEGREWFTTWLAVTDTMAVGAAWEILPYVDIGGTLNVGIHLDALLLNATTQVLHVFACIRKSRPPEPLCCAATPGNISTCCQTGLDLHVSSKNKSLFGDTILIPYPEPDTWYISFTTVCFSGENVVPCAVEEALLSLDIRTQPCVLTKPTTSQSESSIMPCGPYGVCQEIHKGQFFYTACRCIGGYRGWACTDDSQATPEFILLSATLLLTLSNLFFIPAIFLALKRRMFTQGLIYSVTMISSTLYHACDQDIYGYCLTRYAVLQFCDFFCSILAFWVTLIALAKSPPKYDSSLYMLGAVVIAIGVEYNRTGLMVFVFPFALGISIPISVWSYRSIKNRSIIVPPLSNVLLFLPGVVLGAAGLVLFAFVETEDNYRYTHSAWHVIIALSLVYLLPKQQKRYNFEPISAENEANSTAAELSAVNNDNQTTSASPVFFITSDLDHLVQEQSR